MSKKAISLHPRVIFSPFGTELVLMQLENGNAIQVAKETQAWWQALVEPISQDSVLSSLPTAKEEGESFLRQLHELALIVEHSPTELSEKRPVPVWPEEKPVEIHWVAKSSFAETGSGGAEKYAFAFSDATISSSIEG